MQRVGLFSGTFDPIHIGHIEVCLVALGVCELDEVLVMIEKKPHRKNKVTDYKDRKKMAELALEDFQRIKLFDHKADNITFENTLPEIKHTYNKAQVCLIIGSDMLEHLQQWPGAKKWLPNLELCVVLRENKERKAVEAKLKTLDLEQTKVLPAVWSPVSSSLVKSEIAKNHHSDLVHRNVLSYIEKHRLYQG